MIKYIPLNIKSHYSILSSVITPKVIKPLGSNFSFGFCDYNNISGAVQLNSNFPNSLIGIDVDVQDKGKICIFSKNYQGWLQLIKIASEINSEKYINSNIIYEDLTKFYTKDLIFVYKYLEQSTVPNYYFGIDLTENNEYLREVVPNSKLIAFNTTLMISKEQIEDIEVLYCIKDNISIDYCYKKYPKLFSKDNRFYLMTYEEMLEYGYTKNELENTIKLYNQCEKYSILHDLIVPKFDCGNTSSDEYLTKLCYDGFQTKIVNKNLDINKYKERLEYELGIIIEYKLSDYFLIVRDILKYTEDNFYLTNVRGSAAGCLISYLIGLTNIDPIPYNLLFSRFLNVGRLSKDRCSPPDIDCDVPADNREQVLDYIKQKYGHNRVGQILTFQTIKGSAAIKGVFRTKNTPLSFAEVNYITKQIPEMAKVADKIKDMPEDERSLIRYALISNPKAFEQWCKINENGELEGEFSKEFEQAIRLEGIKSAASKHAAGVIISPKDLNETCPTKYDENTNLLICAMEMNDLEALGCLKLDILGLRLFSKIVDTLNDLYIEYV